MARFLHCLAFDRFDFISPDGVQFTVNFTEISQRTTETADYRCRNEAYRIELAPGAEIIVHTIHVSNIDCQRAGLTWGEFFRSFWSDPDKTSTTIISVSVTQRFHPVTYPGSAILPDIEDELRQSEWYENSKIYIAPPSRGELVIEIPTTQPPAVASWIETIIDEMKPLLRERDSQNKLTTDHNDTTDIERPESH